MPKVSIIMGVYNIGSGKKAKVAIQSMLEQTFIDFEFIICDDGSVDDTFNIVNEIAKLDSRIKLIKNKMNLGLAATLNNCLVISKGEYIARMDDDDYSYKDRLKKQVTFLNNNKEFHIVSSAIDIYDGEKVTDKQCIRAKYPKKEDFLWGSCFVHPATMFRKEKLEECGGYRIAKETRRAEDYDLFMRMYSKNAQGYNFEESLLRYYVNPEAMKKRKYIYRIDEAIVRYKGFKMLGLLRKGIFYVIKPIIVGIIPKRTILKIQSNFYKK
ncbi:glycosyltransferase [Clostridium gasigenes]|uniref:glycosyltransferase n=1 Tax=Clostridium gasigenes TaxID=94869 RepID=UPI001C0D562D|nr:glycosyltransferase [Clostridium gasigenes]MBU3137163.1 glycosyltransferase [Clostridium gasigenes]